MRLSDVLFADRVEGITSGPEQCQKLRIPTVLRFET